MIRLCLKTITHRFEFMLVVVFEVLLAVISVAITVINNGQMPLELSQPAYQCNLLFANTMGQVFLLALMPLCISLCCGDCLFMQMKNGIYHLCILRTNRRKYWYSYLIASAIVGFVIAMLPIALNILLCLLAFPYDSNAGYLHYIGYSATTFYSYDYSGHIWQSLANNPYRLNLLILSLIGFTGIAYGILGCIITTSCRHNRVLALAILPVSILILTFCFQSLGLNKYVLFSYFISSPDLHGLSLKDFFLCIGMLFILALVGDIRFEVNRDEIL